MSSLKLRQLVEDGSRLRRPSARPPAGVTCWRVGRGTRPAKSDGRCCSEEPTVKRRVRPKGACGGFLADWQVRPASCRSANTVRNRCSPAADVRSGLASAGTSVKSNSSLPGARSSARAPFRLVNVFQSFDRFTLAADYARRSRATSNPGKMLCGTTQSRRVWLRKGLSALGALPLRLK